MSSPTGSIRKAAILFAALDHRSADALLDQMDSDHAERVRRAAAELDQIDPEEQRRVIGEFIGHRPSRPIYQPAGIKLDGALAEKLGLLESRDRCDDPGDASLSDPPPFRFLHEAAAETLVPFLAREHPQTIAVVVSHLPPKQAAEVLGHLSAPLQTEIIRRLVDLDEAHPDSLRDVEHQFRTMLSERADTHRRCVAGLAAVRSILSAADTDERTDILSNLAQHDRPLAQRISDEGVAAAATVAVAPSQGSDVPRRRTAAVDRKNRTPTDRPDLKPRPHRAAAHVQAVRPPRQTAPPTDQDAPPGRELIPVDAPGSLPPLEFSALANLDNHSLAKVLGAVDPETAILALTGADRHLVDRILAQLPPAHAKTFNRRMERLGPTRLSDVDQAQRRLAHIAAQLASRGVIRLPGPASRLALVG